MAIIIEEPTAEAIFAALQNVPPAELVRLREMLPMRNGDNGTSADPFGPGYSDVWTNEDLEDARRSTALLIEKRFGPEPYDYD